MKKDKILKIGLIISLIMIIGCLQNDDQSDMKFSIEIFKTDVPLHISGHEVIAIEDACSSSVIPIVDGKEINYICVPIGWSKYRKNHFYFESGTTVFGLDMKLPTLKIYYITENAYIAVGNGPMQDGHKTYMWIFIYNDPSKWYSKCYKDAISYYYEKFLDEIEEV